MVSRKQVATPLSIFILLLYQVHNIPIPVVFPNQHILTAHYRNETGHIHLLQARVRDIGVAIHPPIPPPSVKLAR